MQDHVLSLMLQQLQSVEVEDLPVLLKFVLQACTKGNAAHVVTELRSRLHFVTPADPRLAGKLLTVLSLCACSTGFMQSCPFCVEVTEGLHECIRCHTLPATCEANCCLCTCAVPDRKQKAPVLNGRDDPEALLLKELLGVLPASQQAVDAYLKALSGLDKPALHKTVDLWVLLVLMQGGGKPSVAAEALLKKKLLEGAVNVAWLDRGIRGHQVGIHEDMTEGCMSICSKTQESQHVCPTYSQSSCLAHCN